MREFVADALRRDVPFENVNRGVRLAPCDTGVSPPRDRAFATVDDAESNFDGFTP